MDGQGSHILELGTLCKISGELCTGGTHSRGVVGTANRLEAEQRGDIMHACKSDRRHVGFSDFSQRCRCGSQISKSASFTHVGIYWNQIVSVG